RRRRQQGVTVALRLEHHFRADVAARARAVLDHKRLAQPCAKLVRNDTRCSVDPAARGDVDDDLDWLVGIIRVRLRRRGCEQRARKTDHEETVHSFLPNGFSPPSDRACGSAPTTWRSRARYR